jgi:pimeloyl-ACP methyl ester carboxylesterase
MHRFLRILMWYLVLFFTVLLVVPLLIPVPPLKRTLPAEQIAGPDSRFLEVNGLKVHYKTTGQGEPALILLHGFAASTFSWHAVMVPLSHNYQVVAFDRPAFGLTERPISWSGENPYSPEFQPKLTMGLIDQLGINKAILVGNSAGGAVAVLTALRYPERVQALILVDPAIYINSGGPGWLRLLAWTPQMQHIGPLIARQIQSWGRNLAEMAWHDPSKITAEDWAVYTRPTQVENWDKALWYLTAASQDLRLEEQLEKLHLPILVITGDDDRIVPTEQSIRLASELPNAKLVVISDCGHLPQEERPQAFLEAVDSFLNDLQE